MSWGKTPSLGGGSVGLHSVISPIYRTLWVEPNKTETSADDGSFSRPFKKVSYAIAETDGTNGYSIMIYPGGIQETIVPKNANVFFGVGDAIATLDGGSGASSSTVTVNDNVSCQFWNMKIQCTAAGHNAINIDGKTSASVKMFNCLTQGLSTGEAIYIKDTTGAFELFNTDVTGRVLIENSSQFYGLGSFRVTDSSTTNAALYIKDCSVAPLIDGGIILSLGGSTPGTLVENSAASFQNLVTASLGDSGMEITNGGGSSTVTQTSGQITSYGATDLVMESSATFNQYAVDWTTESLAVGATVNNKTRLSDEQAQLLAMTFNA